MAGPPSPPYPSGCGQAWDRRETVTGELPDKDGFGSEYSVELQPLASRGELVTLSRDPEARQTFTAQLQGQITSLQQLVFNASGSAGRRRLLTSKEQGSLEWLLTRAEELLRVVQFLVERWDTRKGGAWPLSDGDNLSDFAGGVCDLRQAGKWIGRGRMRLLCPGPQEISRRQQDRGRIKQYLEEALEHTRCAQWGLNRLLLYKRALAEWHQRDVPELTAQPPGEAPVKPGLDLPMVAPTRDDDLCERVGVGCKPGEEGGLDACPDDFCPDPDDLPDPGAGLGDEPLIPDVEKPAARRKQAMSDATKGLIVVGTVGLIYAGYKMLRP